VAFIEVNGAAVELLQIDHSLRPDLCSASGGAGRPSALY
jgi:hypothetical protein